MARTTWTDLDAVAAVEGFASKRHTYQERISAWQHLITTGLVWKLQGWFGRHAEKLLAQGVVHMPRKPQKPRPKHGNGHTRPAPVWDGKCVAGGTYERGG